MFSLSSLRFAAIHSMATSSPAKTQRMVFAVWLQSAFAQSHSFAQV
ncbi:MAG: hypothetical protein R3D26_21060 [Cyanobacteriota/Melainabacteria group bacterium]